MYESSARILRSARRAALIDISNKAEGVVDHEQQQPKKRQRRLSSGAVSDLIDLTGGSDEIKSTSSSNTLSLINNLKLEPYRLQRSVPLTTKNSNPALYHDGIDNMYNYFYAMEDEYSVKADYITTQTDINAKMRAILIDWLIEVHNKFKLQTQTLWLGVNILDRYVAKVDVNRSKLQLVGLTALFIAAKYEEIYAPEVSECVKLTDGAYVKADILTTETSILDKLSYQIFVPTGFHFIQRYLTSIRASSRTRLVASYYAERNLQEIDSLNPKPHQFAAAAVYAALRQQSAESAWPRLLQEESGLEETDVIAYARVIANHVREESETATKRKLVAAKRKYSSEKFENVASLPVPEI